MKHNLDQTDLGILRLLQEDSRLSHKAIAHHLKKTVTPIHVRIRKLQDEGYIKRYTAIVDPKMIGRGLTVFTQVQLKEHSQESLLAFQAEAVKLTEVMECYHMSGQFDFHLRIVVEDMDAYNRVLMNKLSKLPDVGVMQSFFVLSEAKNETAYSLT